MLPSPSNLKIATVVGARPQFIKVAAMRRAFQEHKGEVRDLLIHTGQHYDDNMSTIFFQELGLPLPDYHLTSGGLSHGAMTGRMLEQIETVLIEEKPDWVMVYGDTNSTLAGALAAAKLGIPIAHVEAGLRSFNRQMPEEINRIVADHCADLLLTTHALPTQQLLREGIPQERICEVGDLMCDIATLYRKKRVKGSSVLVTIHRASNTNDLSRLQEIMDGLLAIADRAPVIFPVHPRTRQALRSLGEPTHPNLRLMEPVGYLEMLTLESEAQLIITDSGGVQKEAYFCHVPCLVLRQETEWRELVDHGYARLVGVDAAALVKSFEEMLTVTHHWDTALYGDGHAAQRILNALLTCPKNKKYSL